MSHLLTCQDVGKSFGAQRLFNHIDLIIHKGDRIGLIGPNGSGKSTLLKILCAEIEADDGQILRRKNVQTAYLAQADVFDEDGSVEQNLLSALRPFNLDELESHNRVQALLSRAEFPDPSVVVAELSGGWRKRLAICRSVVVQPDILIMDEPTNHLDIEGVLWLERMLSGALPKSPDAFLLVSHDRRFLENVASRVVELSAVYPDGSLEVDGGYSQFVQARLRFLEQQQQLEDRLANKMRRETEWLSRGPKARATKAKSRIDAAHELQARLTDVKSRNRSLKQVRIDFDTTGRKTKKLFEAQGISKQYNGRSLFRNLDMVLSPGTRLGLLGRNGCGKSTLMQIIAASGDENATHTSDTGTIISAPKVRIVSFDQKREAINPEITLRQALAPDGDSIMFRDASYHVVSWAQRFLFRSDQLDTPVGQLSGGEQARILIADLMRQPADILLLDEPTNDLDIPSLDILEESLLDFPGALVLVSHDRFLLDTVCDQVLGFNGQGQVAFYADYEQWLVDLRGKKKEIVDSGTEKKSDNSGKSSRNKVGKLSYMDQREYDKIEGEIMEGEATQERLQALMDSPKTAANPQQLETVWADLERARDVVEKLYERWEILEDKKDSGE